MSAILDRSQRTATPHVIAFLVEDGRLVAQCHCGWRRSVSALTPPHLRAAFVKREVGWHLEDARRLPGRAGAAVLICLILAWSCVMSQPVYSIERLSRMSAAQLRSLDLPAPPRKHYPPVTVRLAELTAAQQFALVSFSRADICRQVADRLKASTLRHDANDREILRRHGLAEIEPGTVFHRLTPEGQGFALAAAKKIARELGLHILWQTGGYYSCSVNCTCGWMHAEPTYRYDVQFDLQRAGLVHLQHARAT